MLGLPLPGHVAQVISAQQIAILALKDEGAIDEARPHYTCDFEHYHGYGKPRQADIRTQDRTIMI